MIRLYLIGALAALSLVLGGWVYVERGQSAALGVRLTAAEQSARTAQEALKRSQAASAHRARLRAATERAGASAAHSLNENLAAQPAWAETPVPKEVQDALRQP